MKGAIINSHYDDGYNDSYWGANTIIISPMRYSLIVLKHATAPVILVPFLTGGHTK